MKHVRNHGLRPRVGKTSFIDRIFSFFSRKSRKYRPYAGTNLIHKQDNPLMPMMMPMMAIGMGGLIFGNLIIQVDYLRMHPLKCNCKQNLELFFLIFSRQLLFLFIIGMIIGNSSFMVVGNFFLDSFQSIMHKSIDLINDH